MTESAPATNRLRRYRSPCLLILPSLSLPPLECCFGTSPIPAEKLRVGPVLATARVASIADPKAFRSGRGRTPESAPGAGAAEPQVRRDTHALSQEPACQLDWRRHRAASRYPCGRPERRSRTRQGEP